MKLCSLIMRLTSMFKITALSAACVIIVIALVGLYDSNWNYVLRVTKIKLPSKFTRSPVFRANEVLLSGTIQLDATTTLEFIESNGLKRLVDESKRDDFRALAYLSRNIDQDSQADKFVLLGKSTTNQWEFLLDARTFQIRYQVLCEDYAGDLP